MWMADIDTPAMVSGVSAGTVSRVGPTRLLASTAAFASKRVSSRNSWNRSA